MLTILDMAKEFGYRVGTFHHGVEAYKVADELAENGSVVPCGPTGGDSRSRPMTVFKRTSHW